MTCRTISGWILVFIACMFIWPFGMPHVRVATGASTDPVVDRGLLHDETGRALIERAVEYANQVLGEGDLRLAVAWQSTASQPALGQESLLGVYSVKSTDTALATPAAVPRGCKCVFVNVPVFQSWATVHSTGDGRLDLDLPYLLAFMLLHEVGHVSHGHAAAEFSNGELSQLNIEPSLAKAREEEADEYAARRVREAIAADAGSNAALTATWVSLELTKVSWNMQAYRSLDEFGAATTGKHSVFFDASYSHPNLAWRILRSNHLIQKSDETKALLDAFEAARGLGADPKPLFRRDG